MDKALEEKLEEINQTLKLAILVIGAAAFQASSQELTSEAALRKTFLLYREAIDTSGHAL